MSEHTEPGQERPLEGKTASAAQSAEAVAISRAESILLTATSLAVPDNTYLVRADGEEASTAQPAQSDYPVQKQVLDEAVIRPLKRCGVNCDLSFRSWPDFWTVRGNKPD